MKERYQDSLDMEYSGPLAIDQTLTVSQALTEQLAPLGEQLRTPSGLQLFHQGTKTVGVFLIHSGAVLLYLQSPNGKRISERIMGPRSVLGLPATFTGHPYSLTAVTLEETEYTLVPTDVVRAFVEKNSPFGREILEVLSREVTALQKLLRPAVEH